MCCLVVPRALLSPRRLELCLDKLVEQFRDIALGIRFPLDTLIGHAPTVPFSAAYLSSRGVSRCLLLGYSTGAKGRLDPVLTQ